MTRDRVTSILVLAVVLGSLLLCAGATYINSRQLAPTATDTYLLTTNGTNNAWTDPTDITTRCCDLQDTYDASPITDKAILIIVGNGTFRLRSLDDGNLLEGQFTDDLGLNWTDGWTLANRGDAMFGDGTFYVDASANTATVVDTEYIGDATTQGYERFEDGDGEYDGFTCVDTDVSRDYETMPPTAPGTYAGRVQYDALVTGSVYHCNWVGDRDSFFGYYDSHVGSTDVYAYCGVGAAGHVQYAGTAATDSVGIILPWACTIVGIGACASRFTDASDVATVDIYPRADGANINAACKATLPEAVFPAGPEITATFTAGTYTVTAGQRLGIYLDITDANLNDSVLQNLVVTVWYQFP